MKPVTVNPEEALADLLAGLAPDYVAQLKLRADEPASRTRLIDDLKGKLAQRFPFSDAELRDTEMFDLFLLDGGGFYATTKLVGSTRDQAVADAMSSDEFWTPMGGLAHIDWGVFGAERRIEEHVWLHRWYYHLSLARMYWLTGNEDHARLFRRLYLDWISKHPRPEPGTPSKNRPQWWADMQVVWRVIGGLCSMHLLAGSKELDADFWTGFLANWKASVDLIYGEDVQHGPGRGNHQSHLEMGLAYAAALLSEFTDSRRWWDHATDRLVGHLARFDADFYSKEISPSYAAFVIQHHRDTALLAEKSGLPLPPAIRAAIEPACKALVAAMQPDRRLVALTDAYELDVRPFLRLTAARLNIDGGAWDIAKPEQDLPRLRVFPGHGVASIRSDWSEQALYVLFDFSKQYGGHWHGGKLAFHLCVGTDAFLVDPGCSDYCVSEFEELRQPGMHNSLLVDGVGDCRTLPGRPWSWVNVPDCRVLDSGQRGGVEFVAVQSDWAKAQAHVRHRRAVGLVDRKFFVIADRVDSPGEHEFDFPLHFASLPVQMPAGGKTVVAQGRNSSIEIVPLDDPGLKLFMAPGKVSQAGRSVRALTVHLNITAADTVRTSLAVFATDRKPADALARAQAAAAMLLALLDAPGNP